MKPWLAPQLVKSTAPGFDRVTPAAPRLELDANIVIEALNENGPARAVLEAGMAGTLEWEMANTFDDPEAPDYGGGALPDTPRVAARKCRAISGR